jgi:4-hydroxybenzoate polyprenyltransferase
MRAYLQLVRLPNVFTAMADILLGFLVTHESLEPWPRFVLLLAASSLLYMAGMVLNDYFDRARDARERPFRPIPSGRVAPRAALVGGLGLLAAGALCGWIAAALAGDPRPGLVATALAGCVLLYDAAAKRTPAGPLVMGACRTLNVLLGMSVSAEPWTAPLWAIAGGVGLYIVGVTTFARTEARASRRALLSLGIVVMLAGLTLVASAPLWATGREWPEFRLRPNWFAAWALFGLWLGYRTSRAVLDPRPELVQIAVRTCIFTLVIMDAAAVLAVHDAFWGIVILLLLVPTLLVGRWIYST